MTGTVNPDVSRNVPVISLASGRVIEINARLGDSVTKGQLLLKVQSADISGAYSDYQQAIADEALARKQFERSKLLYERGAIAQKDLEIAEAAETKATRHHQDHSRTPARAGRRSGSPFSRSLKSQPRSPA